MLIDVHVRKGDGSPGYLLTAIDAKPVAGRIQIAGKDYTVHNGVRHFVVIEQEDVRAVKEFHL